MTTPLERFIASWGESSYPPNHRGFARITSSRGDGSHSWIGVEREGTSWVERAYLTGTAFKANYVREVSEGMVVQILEQNGRMEFIPA
jgi:hypothetical protein